MVLLNGASVLESGAQLVDIKGMLIQDSLMAESLCKCVLDTHLKRKNC